MSTFTTRPELTGTFGAVASTHWIATAVAMATLERGGNAFDAAVAGGFVLQIVEPHLNGPGGEAPILAARADDLAPTVICGQGPAPRAASISAFAALGLDLIPGTGLLSACVPGAFGAWMCLARDWGCLPLRDVLAPAIAYARDGHPLAAGAAAMIASVEDLLREWPASAAVFLPEGRLPEAGELVRNAALGDLYTQILEAGEAAGASRTAQYDAALAFWYEGPVSAAIDRFCSTARVRDVSGRSHGGLLAADDMAGWRPPMESPIFIDDGPHRIFKCGPWTQGPVLLQAIGMLANEPAEALALDTDASVHLVTETLKLAFADRDAWLGDAPQAPISDMLDSTYLSARRTLVSPTASLELRPGSPGGRRPWLPPLDKYKRAPPDAPPGVGEPTAQGGVGEPTAARSHVGDTCHIDVVDRWGNMVAATPSGGWLQSSPLIPGLGFALGTRLQMCRLEPGRTDTLAPGKRPRTTLTPSMAYRDGLPYLAFGTPGGDHQEQWSLQLYLRHFRCGRALQAAIDAPAFHTDHLIASFWPRYAQLGSLSIEDRFPQHVRGGLAKRGHRLTIQGPWSEGRLSACAIERRRSGVLVRAAANPRGMQGYAAAR